MADARTIKRKELFGRWTGDSNSSKSRSNVISLGRPSERKFDASNRAPLWIQRLRRKLIGASVEQCNSAEAKFKVILVENGKWIEAENNVHHLLRFASVWLISNLLQLCSIATKEGMIRRERERERARASQAEDEVIQVLQLVITWIWRLVDTIAAIERSGTAMPSDFDWLAVRCKVKSRSRTMYRTMMHKVTQDDHHLTRCTSRIEFRFDGSIIEICAFQNDAQKKEQ